MAKSTSDNIKEYIKQLFAQSGIAEIKQSSLADTFQVVPSQINYMIKAHFTESRGYAVENKHDGRGYIRVARIRSLDRHQVFGNLISSIGERISEQVFTDLVQLLFDEEIITEREGNLILTTASGDVLGKDAPGVRARMLRKILRRLGRRGFYLWVSVR